MINDNKDNLKDNQEQEIENQIEESTVEENSENTATNDIVVDDHKEESISTKKASTKNKMIDYLREVKLQHPLKGLEIKLNKVDL